MALRSTHVLYCSGNNVKPSGPKKSRGFFLARRVSCATLSNMEIRSKDIRIVPIDKIRPNEKNRNQHDDAQIAHLVEQYKYQGFRVPLIASNRSGLLVCGHGRLEAAKLAGLTELPVIYQDFADEASEYAFGVAENATQAWSALDLSGINADLPGFGPELDVAMLGIKNFTIEPLDAAFPDLESGDPDFTQRTFILSTEQADILDQALARAKLHEDCTDEINENAPANALAAILRKYVCG